MQHNNNYVQIIGTVEYPTNNRTVFPDQLRHPYIERIGIRFSFFTAHRRHFHPEEYPDLNPLEIPFSFDKNGILTSEDTIDKIKVEYSERHGVGSNDSLEAIKGQFPFLEVVNNHLQVPEREYNSPYIVKRNIFTTESRYYEGTLQEYVGDFLRHLLRDVVIDGGYGIGRRTYSFGPPEYVDKRAVTYMVISAKLKEYNLLKGAVKLHEEFHQGHTLEFMEGNVTRTIKKMAKPLELPQRPPSGDFISSAIFSWFQ